MMLASSDRPRMAMASRDVDPDDLRLTTTLPSPTTTLPSPTATYRSTRFDGFLQRCSLEGINGLGEKSWYISPSDLEGFWDDEMINSVRYEKHPHISADPSTIRTNYLRLWSILVHIGRPEFITDFIRDQSDDHNLPLKPGGGPTVRTRCSAFSAALEDFRDKQWSFIPVEFRKGNMCMRHLDDRHVLPIDSVETLPSVSLETVVRKVRLRKGCTDDSISTTVVFKECQAEEGRLAWENEIATFTMLGYQKNVVQYFGSFEQNRKLVIILEYANGGSLLNVFEKNQQPGTADQAIKFWEALMELLFALNDLHHANSGVGCAHRDIKPANILVFRDERGDSFDFHLKLADFDRSSGVQRTNGAGTGTQDNDGSYAYCAPEASRFYPQECSTTLNVPLDCDVWSFGCVLSEALAWTGGGEDLRLNYIDRRKDDPNQVAANKGSGYEGCFHDRTNVLPSVLEMHEEAKRGLRRFDIYSPVIQDIIEKFMLQPHDKGRLKAKDVWHQFRISWTALSRGGPLPIPGDESPKIPAGAAISIDSSVPCTPDTSCSNLPALSPSPSSRTRFVPPVGSTLPERGLSSRSRHQLTHSKNQSSNHPTRFPSQRSGHAFESPQSLSEQTVPAKSVPTSALGEAEERPAPYPHISVKDVLDWKISGKKQPLPGREEVRRDLKGREMVFVVDDSKTMQRYRLEVMDTAEALMYPVKDCDPNGIEMRFASEPEKVYKRRKVIGLRTSTTALREVIGRRFDARSLGTCNMESKLNKIVDEVVRKGRQVSIIVLTDGVWERASQAPGGGVEVTIQSLVRKMAKNSANRTDVSVQFVRFGDDEVGRDRLTYLDDNLKKSDGSVLDIVDHRHHTDSVWLMLIGPLSEAGDNYRRTTIRANGDAAPERNHPPLQHAALISPR